MSTIKDLRNKIKELQRVNHFSLRQNEKSLRAIYSREFGPNSQISLKSVKSKLKHFRNSFKVNLKQSKNRLQTVYDNLNDRFNGFSSEISDLADISVPRYNLNMIERRKRDPTKLRKTFKVLNTKKTNFDIYNNKVRQVQWTYNDTVFITERNLIWNEFTRLKRELRANKYSSFVITFKLIDDNTDEEIRRQKAFQVDITEEDFNTKLNFMAQGENSSKYLQLQSFKMIEWSKVFKGGCMTLNHKDGTQTYLSNKNKTRKVKVHSPKSKGNNCLIACFKHHFGIGRTKNDKIRKTLSFPIGTMLAFDDFDVLCNHFKIGGIIYDYTMKMVHTSNLLCSNLIHIQLTYDKHYSLIKQFITVSKCSGCGREYISKHKCNVKMRDYYQTQVLKENILRGDSRKIHSKDLDYSKIIHWDLETITSNMNEHSVLKPYSSSYVIGNGEVVNHFGLDCLSKTVDDFMKMSGMIINAYNGAGFDHYFLNKELLRRGVKVHKLLQSDSRVLGLEFEGVPGEHNKIFDLQKFTVGSLADCCKSFDIKMAKLPFDCMSIKTMSDATAKKDIIIEYNNYDVYALRELFEKFQGFVFSEFGHHITDYMTGSSLSYSTGLLHMDSAELPDGTFVQNPVVYIPKDSEEIKFIRSTVYGGRVYPQQDHFKTKHFDNSRTIPTDKKDIFTNDSITYESVIKSKDYIFNADANGLYTAAMTNTDIFPEDFLKCDGYFPIGKPRWTLTPLTDFKSGKMGFYEVKHTAPQNLRDPILPYKHSGNIIWSNESGRGVYTSVDIENAKFMGYDIEFVGKALVYNEKARIFEPYLRKLLVLKKKFTLEKNKVKRAIIKILLNSFYGKMLQRAILSRNTIINSPQEFYDFTVEHNPTKLDRIFGDTYTLEGIVKPEFAGMKNSKPIQMGAFTLGYSRRMMMNYACVIDSTGTQLVSTYKDTDSLHISSNDYSKIEKYINDDSGGLNNDYKNDAVIIQEYNISPKCYATITINKFDEIEIHMKCKGIISKTLDYGFYTSGKSHEIIMKDRLKKIHFKRNSKQQDIDLFSIISVDMSRTFNKNPWGSMRKCGSQWIPFNNEFPNPKLIC